MSSQPCKTPLVDLLREVPYEHRIGIEMIDSEGIVYGHHLFPIGKRAHQAADTIESLQQQLDDAAKRIRLLEYNREKDSEFAEYLKQQLAEAEEAAKLKDARIDWTVQDNGPSPETIGQARKDCSCCPECNDTPCEGALNWDGICERNRCTCEQEEVE